MQLFFPFLASSDRPRERAQVAQAAAERAPVRIGPAALKPTASAGEIVLRGAGERQGKGKGKDRQVSARA